MDWTAYGPHALLIRYADEVGDTAFQRGRALESALERHPPAGLLEVVPSFTSLLLEFDPHEVPRPSEIAPDLVKALKRAISHPPKPGPVVEIPVVYDGPDLKRVAKEHQLSMESVVRLHLEPVYKVYMLGFAPGFPYLGDLNKQLHTPRMSTPRTRVPAGAVAIGGEHTGIYPGEGPGGWNLIGRAEVKLFDAARGTNGRAPEEMFLLKAGDRVRFVQKGA